MTIDSALKDADHKMEQAVSHLKEDLAGIRTGRASASVLNRVTVEYYGTPVPLNQLASVTVPEPRLLAVTPFDKGAIGAIEKAIQSSDLGITPSNDGQVIRLAFPPLTEERRKDLVKVIHKLAEEGRVAVRHARGDAMSKVKKLSGLPKDDIARAEKDIQKFTDEHIKQIDVLIQSKEQELLQV